MFSTVGRLKSASGLYCVQFFISLLHDASAERCSVVRLHVVRLSVCPSETIRYCDHIGWNSSKIISRRNSLRPMRSLMPNKGDVVQRHTPKIRVE